MSSTREAAYQSDVQSQRSYLQDAQHQLLNMHALVRRLESEASDDECDHGKCFGALVLLLEGIDQAMCNVRWSLERDADAAAAEEHP